MPTQRERIKSALLKAKAAGDIERGKVLARAYRALPPEEQKATPTDVFLHRSGIGPAARVVKDYFTDERKPGDEPVSRGRAAGLAVQQAFGADDGEIARDDLSQSGGFGGEGSRYLPRVEPPADAPLRAEIDAAREDEVRRASDQYPAMYRGVQAAAVAPDLMYNAATAPFRAAGGVMRKFATSQGARAAGYTPSMVARQTRPAVERSVQRMYDEGIMDFTSSQQEMAAKALALKDEAGAGLGATRQRLDEIGEGVGAEEMIERMAADADLGRIGTSKRAALDKALSKNQSDALAFSNQQDRVPVSDLAEAKDYFSDLIRKRGQGKVEDLYGEGALQEQHRRTLRGMEDEVYERAAPEALPAKRRLNELYDAEEALDAAANREVIGTKGPTVLSTANTMLQVLAGGNPQIRGVLSDRAAKLLNGRWANVFNGIRSPREMVVALQVIRQQDPEVDSILGED
jgi:hypothetical protein